MSQRTTTRSDDGNPATETEQKVPGRDETATESGETGGPSGPEPTRYGDWEKNGRCIDF